METIKVFTGMAVHGTVEMVVLKTLANGVKLCWFDHKNDDEDSSWDELWLAQKNVFDRNYGGTEWYGIGSKNIKVDLDVCMEVRVGRNFRAEFSR
jgi:hypothetical protein